MYAPVILVTLSANGKVKFYITYFFKTGVVLICIKVTVNAFKLN